MFSSILAIHFSAAAEKTTGGFALSEQDQLTLAGGGRVTLSNSGGDRLTVELVVNFPDYASEPLPTFAGNVRNSNPFDVLVVDDNLFVTNGGLNKLFKVDLDSGAFADLAVFDRIPNLPGAAGPPSVEAVPTGLAYSDGTVLVSLLSGGPFLPGLSRIKAVDPITGAQADFITGLRTSIDILPVRDGRRHRLPGAGEQLRPGASVPAHWCVDQALRGARRNRRRGAWLHDGPPDVDVARHPERHDVRDRTAAGHGRQGAAELR